jgi:2-polyprenyl-3-methyl-5-hydroxy-6-metoxy-1,4-benzoquinol methylase
VTRVARACASTLRTMLTTASRPWSVTSACASGQRITLSTEGSGEEADGLQFLEGAMDIVDCGDAEPTMGRQQAPQPRLPWRCLMDDDLPVDPAQLREQVKSKYRDVAVDPHGDFHFHTGRPLARRLGYDSNVVDGMPDAAVESFAGVANPLSTQRLALGERVVDAGSGAGFDCFIAAHQVGPEGRVIGIDMLDEMLAKSRDSAENMGLHNVEFREGLLESMPVEDGWADVVISNGVINLCADKKQVFQEIWRILRPGGRLQFADIANGKPVPASALQNIDLWTA